MHARATPALQPMVWPEIAASTSSGTSFEQRSGVLARGMQSKWIAGAK
jgi:hypothetical protein